MPKSGESVPIRMLAATSALALTISTKFGAMVATSADGFPPQKLHSCAKTSTTPNATPNSLANWHALTSSTRSNSDLQIQLPANSPIQKKTPGPNACGALRKNPSLHRQSQGEAESARAGRKPRMDRDRVARSPIARCSADPRRPLRLRRVELRRPRLGAHGRHRGTQTARGARGHERSVRNREGIQP